MHLRNVGHPLHHTHYFYAARVDDAEKRDELIQSAVDDSWSVHTARAHTTPPQRSQRAQAPTMADGALIGLERDTAQNAAHRNAPRCGACLCSVIVIVA